MVQERRRYRKTLTRMWADEKFQNLTRPHPNGQSLWQYLITGPHTTSIPGLSSIGEAALAEALGWPLPGFRKAWKEIEGQHMAMADWKARVVWLPKAITHNSPENPNVVKHWRYALDDIPECSLKAVAIEELKHFVAVLGEPFLIAFLSILAHPSRNQEQEQDLRTGTGTIQ